MNNFEDIQNSWLAQPLADAAQPVSINNVQSKWQQHQRKVLINNWKITAGFTVVFVVVGMVYLAFKERYHWPFHASIAAMYGLMFVFLGVTWKSYALKKESFEHSSAEFIDYQISKLNWQRKTLTTFVWIYNVLLWLALSLYTVEITRTGSLTFTLTALSVTTAYLVGLTIWARFYKQKKQIKEIDEIISELKDLQIQLLKG